MNDEKNALTVIQETEILGKKIKMYGTIEFPWFVASDVAEWLGERDGYTVSRKVDTDEKATQIVCTHGGNQKTTVLTEDGLYEACMNSRKDIAKPLRKEIKNYLKSIRLTGGAVKLGAEEQFVNYYLSSLSGELKDKVIIELHDKTVELQKFYDDLINTEGLYHMNIVAKELKIGRNTMLSYLRGKEIFFYQDNANVPYQRFMNQGLFSVKESPCADGKYRPVTYATKKGLEYIRKLLHKDGYYDVEVTA